jgi:hypothetical protein
LFQCGIYRLLFLLFLAVFAVSPVVDAYVDSLCPSSACFNDLDDSDSSISTDDLKLNDARKFLHAFNRASRQDRDNHALFLSALAKDDSAGQITGPQLPTNDRCSSQRCSLASADPSPSRYLTFKFPAYRHGFSSLKSVGSGSRASIPWHNYLVERKGVEG